MTYDVRISEQADIDLRSIFEYIAFELQAPENAAGQLDRLEQNIIGLERLPYRFRKFDREPWHSRGLRIMPVDNYIVFYVVDDAAQAVNIVRVMYGARDIELHIDINK